MSIFWKKKEQKCLINKEDKHQKDAKKLELIRNAMKKKQKSENSLNPKKGSGFV